MVGFAEGNALCDQVVRKLGRVEETGGEGAGHADFIEAQGLHHARHKLQGRAQGVVGVKERLLVFLEVTVVGQGEALQDGEHGGQIAVHPAHLAAHDFGDVGVFLLGHDGGARGIGVGQLHEAEGRV